MVCNASYCDALQIAVVYTIAYRLSVFEKANLSQQLHLFFLSVIRMLGKEDEKIVKLMIDF